MWVITQFNADGWCVVASCDDETYGGDVTCVFRLLLVRFVLFVLLVSFLSLLYVEPLD